MNADDDESVDIALGDTTQLPDVSSLALNRARRPPSLNLKVRRLSSSLSSPSSPELAERQSRPKPTISPTSILRSKTLPRSFLKSPIRETVGALDLPALESDAVAKLRRWIVSFITVYFDLDEGPTVQGVYPLYSLTQSEKETICFSSFPDSTQFREGQSVHTFRIRQEQNAKLKRDSSFESSPADGFLYGFSFFSRRKDDSVHRGYDQRSLVILTRHPWPALYIEMLNRVGPMHVAHGDLMLETACHNVANWPSPSSKETLELGFLGAVLNVELPDNVDQQQLTETMSFKEKFDPRVHILASLPPTAPPPLLTFGAALSHMWSLWECLVLCEPLLIFGQTPSMTSQAVWWLLDILRPIPFAGDFRPYFTIYDNDYASILTKGKPKSGLILGVTNPIFSSMCKHWPHQLSLGNALNGKITAMFVGPPPGWRTKTHNRYISKDKELLQRLKKLLSTAGFADADGEASLALRRHFTTRSVQFLVPLNRYLNTLIPSPSRLSSGISPDTHSIKPFNHEHFLTSLKTHGSPLPFRSSAKQRDFYERWLRTPAFGLWVARQEETVNRYLRNRS